MRISFWILSSIFICNSCFYDLENTRESKLECYSEKLEKLKKESIYNEVMTQFIDTFPKMLTEKEVFGLPDRVENRIDSSIFFNKNRDKCLLIVLRKTKAQVDLIFGNAQIIRGEMKSHRWFFDPIINFGFSESYFSLYPKNDFENLSKAARFSVITEGRIDRKGCQIDEYFWFVDFK